MEDVEEIEGMKAEVSSTFSQAIEKRQQTEGHLKTALTDNGESLKKLRSLSEMKQQSSTSKMGSSAAKKRLEGILEEEKRS